MQYAPLTQSDIDDAPEWARSIELRPDRWRDDHTRSVVALDGVDAVAAGILWTSRIHPTKYWFAITVAPTHRRRGIGRAVFAHLSALRAADLPFMTRGYVDDEGMLFARALGARTIQVVPPATALTSAREALREHPSVESASALGWDAIEAANAAIYEWTHASWAPVGPDFAGILNEDLRDELDLEASSVAIVDGAIVAACFVYDDDRPFLTGETVSAATPEGERLMEGCVRRSLDVLAARGVAEVEFDGHVSDPHLHPVWTRLNPTGRWFHLVTVPAASQ